MPIWERVVLAIAGVVAVVLAILGDWVGAALVGIAPAVIAVFEALRFALRLIVRRTGNY